MKIEARINGREATLDRGDLEERVVRVQPGTYSALVGGRSLEVYVETLPDGRSEAFVNGRRYLVEVRDPRRSSRGGAGAPAAGPLAVKAPMPGKVVAVSVEPGEAVETEQGLLVIEAMKMQNEIRSPKAGIVAEVRVRAGDSVSPGQPLVIVE